MRHHLPGQRLSPTSRAFPAYPAAACLTELVRPAPPALCPVAAMRCPGDTQPRRLPAATLFRRGKLLLLLAIAKRRHRRGRVPDEAWVSRGGAGSRLETPSRPVAFVA